MTLLVRPPELVLEDILKRAYDKFADMLKVTSVQKKWRPRWSARDRHFTRTTQDGA